MKKLREKLAQVNKFISGKDRNTQEFLDSSGTVRHRAIHVCFGMTSDYNRKDWVRDWNKQHPDNLITHIRVVQADAVQRLTNEAKSDEILSIMSSWGLFRNCEVIREGMEIMIKFPLDIRAQEIWFVGWCVRQLAAHPLQMLKFLNLTKKFPDVDTFKLFRIGLCYRSRRLNDSEKGCIPIRLGHLGDETRNLLLVSDTSVADIQKEIDTYPTWIKSNSYNFNNGLMSKLYKYAYPKQGEAGYKFSLMWVSKEIKMVNYLEARPSEKLAIERSANLVTRPTYSRPITKEILETYLDFDKFCNFIFKINPTKERVINAFNITR